MMFSRGANLDSMVIAECCFLVDEFNQHHESGVLWIVVEVNDGLRLVHFRPGRGEGSG